MEFGFIAALRETPGDLATLLAYQDWLIDNNPDEAARLRSGKGVVYVTYCETKSGGGIREGQEDEEWPTYEDVNYELDVRGCHRSEQTGLQEQILSKFYPIVGTYVYVVIVRYFDGGSFGRSRGRSYFYGVYQTEEEAVGAERSILSEQNDTDVLTYRPWKGYFSGLENVEIHKLEVLK